MMYALNAAGERIEADPGGRASCPGCHGDVIAHCGEILVWHWAHRSRLECDPWWEPETAWHRGWKLFVPAAQREVVIGGHRADMVLANGTVCELQASGISAQEIRER